VVEKMTTRERVGNIRLQPGEPRVELAIKLNEFLARHAIPDCVPGCGVGGRAFLEAVRQVRGAAGKASSAGWSVRSAMLAAAM